MTIVRTTVVLLLTVILLSGCVKFESQRGIDVAWQDEVMANLEKGKNTRAEVLALLGPPSQVISLPSETVLYYLFEKVDGNGAILILFNTIDIKVQYDRAIFFFDKDDVLTDFSSEVHADDNS